MALIIGEQAPDFTLASTIGTLMTLSKDLANRPCLLYFYPKDFTPGCNAEACEFRDHFEEFKNVNIPVYGISTDSITTHLKFKKKYQLPLSYCLMRVEKLPKNMMHSFLF